MPGVNDGRPALFRVELGTFALGKLIELLLVEQLVQTLVERMARSRGQLVMRDPQTLLPSSSFPSAHRHKNILW
jgi:hypothetical protein